MKFQDALQHVLREEGGFVNHPKDPGGMTNLGVTRRALEDFRGGDVSEEEMRALTPYIVAPFYEHMYWDKCRCGELPSGVDYFVFDTAVNQGVGAAARLLQLVVGASIDGIIGRQTVTMAKTQDAYATIMSLAFHRALRYMETRNIDVFGKGWAGRLLRVRNIAVKAVND